MENIEIELDKRKLRLIFLLLLIFSVIGFCFLLFPESFTSNKYDSTEFIRIIGLVVSILFLPGLLILGKKISSPQFGLLINKEGIVDNGTGSSLGLVTWDDIIRFQIIPTSKILLIRVRKPQKYINQGSSRLVRFFLSLNNRIYGSPVVIPTVTLKIEAAELEMVLMRAFKKR